jgi:hypothetical protein
MKRKVFPVLVLISIVFGSVGAAFAISAAEKSMQDYVYTLTLIRDMAIMVENFGTDDQKKKFEDIRTAFKITSERHYAQEFLRPVTLDEEAKPDNNAQYSTELFLQLKGKIADLMNELSKNYISRSQQILDSTSKDTNEILIEYGKNSGLAKYFYRAIDPLVDINKPYQTDKYHYFHDKETLERYLKNGYKALQDARNLINNPDFIYVNNKKDKSDADLNFILNTEVGITTHCRQAKRNGIEIHKLLNSSSLGSIQRKYNVTLGKINNNPIYDDRIPEVYKVDAVDNQKLLYKVEKQRIAGFEVNKDAPKDIQAK